MNARTFKLISGADTAQPSRFSEARSAAARRATLCEGEKVIADSVTALTRLRALGAATDAPERLRRISADLEALARELTL